MRIPTIVIGIGAIIVIAAIVWMVRNNKKEAYIEARNGRCPRGTRVKYLMRRGKKTTVCVGNPGGNALDKFVARKFPYWGWGVHEGLRCKYPDNTGCNTVWHNGKLYMKYGN
jgi:hypothetical protein